MNFTINLASRNYLNKDAEKTVTMVPQQSRTSVFADSTPKTTTTTWTIGDLYNKETSDITEDYDVFEEDNTIKFSLSNNEQNDKQITNPFARNNSNRNSSNNATFLRNNNRNETVSKSYTNTNNITNNTNDSVINITNNNVTNITNNNVTNNTNNNVINIINNTTNNAANNTNLNIINVRNRNNTNNNVTNNTNNDKKIDFSNSYSNSRSKNSGLYDVNNMNGEIDDYKQQKEGDCWLLSGIYSLASTTKGKKVLKDAVSSNGNGSYNVSFKGLKDKITAQQNTLHDENYDDIISKCDITITEEELIKAIRTGKYSTGDNDVLLLELAYEKLRKLNNDNEFGNYKTSLDVSVDQDTPLRRGTLNDVVVPLFGDEIQRITYPNEKTYNEVIDKYSKNSDNTALQLNISCENINEPLKDIYGRTIYNSNGYHAVSVISVENDLVTIVNPWDTSVKSVVKKDDLYKYVSEIYNYNIA